MGNESEGIAWFDNFYQKFEAMCMEVNDMAGEETLRYVENQLQTVGSNVRQFCTELIEELLPSSPTNSSEGLSSQLVQNVVVAAYEDSNISVHEDHIRTELNHSSSVNSVEDVHFGLSSVQITEDNCSLAHSSGLTPPGAVILSRAFKNELTADDISLASMQDASDKSVTKMEPEIPSFDKIMLEASCIIVDSSELHSLSNEVEKRRSYKKKLREAFSFKSRVKKPNDEHHALSRQTNEPLSQDVEFCESDWEII